jgi:hypothetical protein
MAASLDLELGEQDLAAGTDLGYSKHASKAFGAGAHEARDRMSAVAGVPCVAVMLPAPMSAPAWRGRAREGRGGAPRPRRWHASSA